MRLAGPSRSAILASALFLAAVGFALLRVGVLTQAGGVRVGADWRMTDFYSSHYYPVQAFLSGENPHDRERFMALYPVGDPYAPFLPINLLLHLPFGLLSPAAAGLAYFVCTLLLTLALGYLVLRLADLDVSRSRVVAVAGAILLTRPGHWTLLLGQGSILLTVASYLSLLYANRSPARSGMALAVSVLKPTFGLPLAFLMLARGTVRAVVIGVLLSLAINLPLYLALADRAGGAREFLQVLATGLQTSQEARNANPATSPHRVDATALVSRGLERPLSPAGQLELAAGMLVLAALTLRRLAHLPGRGSEDLAIAIICLSIALFGSHLGYDLVILAAPLAALIGRGLPEPGGPITRWVFLALYAAPAMNWLTTDSVLAAWRPSPSAWLLAASINGACVMALFLGYVSLAWLHRGVGAQSTELR